MMHAHRAWTLPQILTTAATLAGWSALCAIPHAVLASQPPVARITTTPTDGTAPLTVGLDAGNSRDPDGTITAYDWDFGDATAHGAGATATHTYQTPGAFSVLLTATDNDGQIARITTTIHVSTASADAPLSIAPEQLVHLAALAVEPPTITPSGGTFTEPVTAAFGTRTIGAVIYYTTDGGAPTARAEGSSRLYTEPVTLANGATTVKALATLNGLVSPITEVVFTIAAPTVALPTIQPAGGVFSGSVGITLQTTTPDSQIRYTLDGTEPSKTSVLYTGTVMLIQSALVQARAFRDGFEPSGIAVAAFTVTPLKTAMPLIAPASGTFTGEMKITLTSATPGAHIRYTLDGTEPGDTSLLFRPPLILTSSATLRTRAFFSDYEPSDVASAAFTLNPMTPAKPAAPKAAAPQPVMPKAVTKAVMPNIQPQGGSSVGSVKVTLSTTTPNAKIRYTVDGTEPTERAPAGKAVTLTKSATLTAKAFRNGYEASDPVSATFTVTPKTAKPVIETPEGMNVLLLQVTMRTTEDGAEIRYTIDGTDPTEQSPRYTASVALGEGTVVKARAFRAGAVPSDVATAVFKRANEQASNDPHTQRLKPALRPPTRP